MHRYVGLAIVAVALAVVGVSANFAPAGAIGEKFNPRVRWYTWREAIEQSEVSDKRCIMLICLKSGDQFSEIIADAFHNSDEFAKLSTNFLMAGVGDISPEVKADETAAYAPQGKHAARIVFINPQTMQPYPITTPHYSFPYFYWEAASVLKNMKLAVAHLAKLEAGEEAGDESADAIGAPQEGRGDRGEEAQRRDRRHRPRRLAGAEAERAAQAAAAEASARAEIERLAAAAAAATAAAAAVPAAHEALCNATTWMSFNPFEVESRELGNLREVVSREHVEFVTPAPPVPELPGSEPPVPGPTLQPAVPDDATSAVDPLVLSGSILVATLIVVVSVWCLRGQPCWKHGWKHPPPHACAEATPRVPTCPASTIVPDQPSGTKFYDMVLRVPQLNDLLADGFVLEGGGSADVGAASSVGLSIVSFLGYFNTGKTSLVARLCETEDSPAGDECHTEGLAVKIAQKAGLKTACVDTEGLATPVTDATDGVSFEGLRQRKTLEDFQRELASEIADCIVFVCDKISYRDQMDVYCLLDNEAIKLGKKVIVVHNLRTVRDVDAMARYQGKVFRMYGTKEVQWATVDGPKCCEAIPTDPGPHRLVHTNGHYNQLVHVFLGDENEPAMRALNVKAIEWLRTTVAGCAKKRRRFGECVRAAVQRILSSYFVKLGDKYDVCLEDDTSATTGGVQRVVLKWAGDETPAVIPRELHGLVSQKKGARYSITTDDACHVVTVAVPGVSSKADVSGIRVQQLGNDRVEITFSAHAPLLPRSACGDAEALAALVSGGGTRDTKGPNDVDDVKFVLSLPRCSTRLQHGAGGGVVWFRLEKFGDFMEEPTPPNATAASPV